MARLKLKQILSNLSYNETTEQLTLNGTVNPSLIVSGSILIVPSENISGSMTIEGFDTFGDDNTPNTIDLGTY